MRPSRGSRSSHLRRKFYELYVSGNQPIATAALARIKLLYDIEAEISGMPPEVRRAMRQEKAKPIVEALKPWLEASLAKVPKGGKLGERRPRRRRRGLGDDCVADRDEQAEYRRPAGVDDRRADQAGQPLAGVLEELMPWAWPAAAKAERAQRASWCAI